MRLADGFDHVQRNFVVHAFSGRRHEQTHKGIAHRRGRRQVCEDQLRHSGRDQLVATEFVGAMIFRMGDLGMVAVQGRGQVGPIRADMDLHVGIAAPLTFSTPSLPPEINTMFWSLPPQQ